MGASVTPQASPTEYFHYTDAAGLAGIVANRELWATDIRFLNDPREYQYACDVVRAVCEQRVARIGTDRITAEHAAQAQAFIEKVRTAPQLDAADSSHRTYVVSLTRHGDLLSQWRGYCPRGGFAIGFRADLPSRLELTCRGNLDIYFSNCEYSDYEQGVMPSMLAGELGLTLSSVIDAFGEKGIDEPSSQSSRDRNVLEAMHGINGFWYSFRYSVALQKHRAFQEEGERRLVVSVRPGHSNEGAPRVHFRPRGAVLIPYLRIPFRSSVEHPAISSIRVSPGNSADLAYEGLKELKRGVDWLRDVKLHRSDCQFRGV